MVRLPLLALIVQSSLKDSRTVLVTKEKPSEATEDGSEEVEGSEGIDPLLEL